MNASFLSSINQLKEKELAALESRLALTAVFFITAVRTVLKAVALEAANDAMDPTSAGEECGTASGLGFR